jgi:transcriptional regulator with XRE-family HTH domain
LFAERLAQARLLRGLSQRLLGDKMGLGKKKGSSRINRYEHQVTAVGFDNLDKLAKLLNVPAAYLLADTPEMAAAILAFASADPKRQPPLVQALQDLSTDPAMVKLLLRMQQLPKAKRAKIRKAVALLVSEEST